MVDEENKVTRCYAQYIFLDVVQFSKRSAEAQSEIVGMLNRIVDQALKTFEVPDDDTILIPTGDGLCIALINASFAYDIHIQLALDILNRTNEYNTQTEKETRRFQLRIGINQNTDILIADINGRRNIAGAGINMASRIMVKPTLDKSWLVKPCSTNFNLANVTWISSGFTLPRESTKLHFSFINTSVRAMLD